MVVIKLLLLLMLFCYINIIDSTSHYIKRMGDCFGYHTIKSIHLLYGLLINDADMLAEIFLYYNFLFYKN